MQTTIKGDFDAGLPGDLAVLPSFRSSARVSSRRAGGEVAPGDAVKLTSGNDSTVVALANATVTIGIAVSAHSNMPAMPGFGSNTRIGVVTINCPIGVVENGPVRVAVKAGESPKVGDLAIPKGRNNTTGYMEWGVANSGDKSRFRFETTTQRGGTAIVMVVDGELLSAGFSRDVPVTGISVSPKTASKAVGGTQQLTPTITPSGAANKTVTYQSGNENVATVDSAGLVTVKAGATTGQTATITVRTDDGGFTDTAVITVS
ncbi:MULTISPECIES: Ig-like domain-containing protein [Citrobacter]|uniref:Ig-like domain-containing protein n=1 Tax=Citrobacter TaxID=544 RepID=UPI0015EAFA14|nr:MULTISPECIES: Ig-like domain-containing protein [unclassified Citrobacter]HCB1742892.1 Ig domain-containing protein [Citrobacter braakii]MBA7876251.1 Ig domain-containing protein [Citrobacter sp. RHBSTW-00827]MBA7938706.1 Ig domain-containing protein [Citrobacter sp. RHBSTW-00509]QLS94756.1 Ig domain-containing protein [Citrobacter sp. RHBSTW-00859]QLT54139.1 Ig domain-containing protein [Citrobacter sp. RHBSTW-00821]